MTPTTTLIEVLLVLAVKTAGASLKVSRYASANAAVPTDSVDGIVRVMSGYGWSLVEQSDDATATLYDHLGFRKNGCAQTIAAMGGNAEAAEFFRQRYLGAAAFIQGGEVVERPCGARRQFRDFNRACAHCPRLEALTVAPILAISPAPPADQSEDCLGPPANAWRQSKATELETSTNVRAELSAGIRRWTMRKILAACIFTVGLSAVAINADAALAAMATATLGASGTAAVEAAAVVHRFRHWA
jgi:hypothetical protein